MSTSQWVKLITIPLFTGVVGWLINWTGLLMLFHPVRFRGVRIPGLQELSTLLPRRLQEIPGVMQGGIGWQGIVRARPRWAASPVDKAIAKLGTPSEFYTPARARRDRPHIVATFVPQVPEIVDRTMRREHPGLWQDVPPRAKHAVYARVQQQLPSIVHQITDEIGLYIDQLLDPEADGDRSLRPQPGARQPNLPDVGRKELRLMVNFGFLFGFLFGIPVAIADHFVHQWWLLPILGVIVGWTRTCSACA